MKNYPHIHSIKTKLGESVITFAGLQMWKEITKNTKMFQKNQLKNDCKNLGYTTRILLIFILLFVLRIIVFSFILCFGFNMYEYSYISVYKHYL